MCVQGVIEFYYSLACANFSIAFCALEFRYKTKLAQNKKSIPSPKVYCQGGSRPTLIAAVNIAAQVGCNMAMAMQAGLQYKP